MGRQFRDGTRWRSGQAFVVSRRGWTRATEAARSAPEVLGPKLLIKARQDSSALRGARLPLPGWKSRVEVVALWRRQSKKIKDPAAMR